MPAREYRRWKPFAAITFRNWKNAGDDNISVLWNKNADQSMISDQEKSNRNLTCPILSEPES
jgi:hypothetical protein